MSLIKTNLTLKDLEPHKRKILDKLFERVPAGVGSKGFVKLNNQEFKKVVEEGTKWCVNNGYGWNKDLEFTEENGCMEEADSNKISERAIQRGFNQIGTLGSGNHYLEVQVVKEENIKDREIAKKLGFFPEQIVIMWHCGSRGFGHQVATDYLQLFLKVMESKYGIRILDRELACAPFSSKEGQDYFKAMQCGINMSFANRQVIGHRIREVFSEVFKQDAESLGMDLVYSVAHNTAKLEKHNVDGKVKELLVHRKGATRAFGPGREEIPKAHRDLGQVIIIGGSMVDGSYVLVGTDEGMKKTFGSTCFTGETKLITDKGIITISEIFHRFNKGENFYVPSLNTRTLKIEWKAVKDAIKLKDRVIEVSISQRGCKPTLDKLRTTEDHKFITVKDGGITYEPIIRLIENNRGLCILDKFDSKIVRNDNKELSYLVGALISDGYFRYKDGHGQINFIQKKIISKLAFIEEVQKCFYSVFNEELREKNTYYGGGMIGNRQIVGSGTHFICTKSFPAIKIIDIYNNLDSWILNTSYEATLSFLAGLIDGDGTWNKKRQILQIYTGDEKVVAATLIACLKLGTVPLISKQRKTCFIIQICEKEEEIFRYTKRVKGDVKNRKYGTKLFMARQLFEDFKKTKWPFLHKGIRNNLMSDKVIKRYIHKYKEKDKILRLVNSGIRMKRIVMNKYIGEKDVFNINVEDNHNYIVLSDMFTPILVKNCHGSGRTMSRTKAKRMFRGDKIQKDMEKMGILVKTVSMPGLAEEWGPAYKKIDEVIEATVLANISKPVCKLLPILNVKG